MAVDTRPKRASMLQLAQAFGVHLVVADGTLTQADRQHFVALYAGLLAGAPVEPPVGEYRFLSSVLRRALRWALRPVVRSGSED